MENRNRSIQQTIESLLLIMSVLCSLCILYIIGYNTSTAVENSLNQVLEWCFFAFALTLFLKAVLPLLSLKKKRLPFNETILFLYFLAVTIADSYYFLGTSGTEFIKPEWMYIGIFAVMIIEASKTTLFFDQLYFSPALLFVLSFLFLILVGTALLLLPKSVQGPPLSFVDALFLATSSVCITGLSVVDLAHDLTRFGQTIILVLVQIGGLGVMTFTGFFGHFFSGSFSFKNQLMYTELIGENKIGSVIKTLYQIILITFLSEAVGVILILLCTDSRLFDAPSDHLFFAVFHGVGAFCNAGFSTIHDGMNSPLFRFNYPLHLVLILIYFVGGLGFGVVLNVYELMNKWIHNLSRKYLFGRSFVYPARMLRFNARIILITSLGLSLISFIIFVTLEYRQTLQEHATLGGKIVTALFLATSPRTSGFNTVNLAELSFPTVMILLLLMYIGAAPGSTGGGIKVTTFTVAILAITSLARGREQLQVFGRSIAPDAILRALVIITLSLIYLGLSVFMLSVTDSDKNLLSLAFESFSAYSTTGLSLGVTPELSNAGKIVILFTMFIGRVGALTLLIAFMSKSTPKNVQYPTEQIQFN